MLLTATILFILLSPGLLLTLPPVGKIWMSGKMSVMSVFVHAVVFFVLLSYRRSIPLLNQLEGFQTATCSGTVRGNCNGSASCINTGTAAAPNYRCGRECTTSEAGLCTDNKVCWQDDGTGFYNDKNGVSTYTGRAATFQCKFPCSNSNRNGGCPINVGMTCKNTNRGPPVNYQCAV